MQDLQTNIRELILSSNPDSCLLGLILNDSYKCFPNVRKFYRKYKRSNFWHFNRVQSVIVSSYRYYSLSAVLNNELKTHKCSFWLDYLDSEVRTPWQTWQHRIGIGSKAKKNLTYKYYSKWVAHPYTTMFVRWP
jgi:hypothetical protein